MLKLTWIELFLRTIPEMFIMIWGIHVISKTPLNMKKYIMSSIILGTLSFFIRWLPIYFGVHIVINMLLDISVMVIVGMPLIQSIYGTLLMYFILSFSEFLQMIILRLLNINLSVDFLDPLKKCLYCTQSLIFMSLFIIAIKIIHLKSKRGDINVLN